MRLRTLRYFVAVADAGTLTGAAAAIPLAQPALTRQMRELEAELGVQLLQRLPRGVRLTQAGLAVYESAQRILAEASRLQQTLARSRSVENASVVLGAPPTLARLLLPGLYENCAHVLEGISLNTRETSSPGLLDLLERGLVDMAVVTSPPPDRPLLMQQLLAEPFALVSHADMKLPRVVMVSHLARIPLLMTSLHRGIVERQLQLVGRTLNVQSEIDSVDTIRELVWRGRSATLMPVSVFKEHGRTPRPIVLSEVSGVQLHRQLVLAARQDLRADPVFSLVRELVEAEFARLSRDGTFSFGTGAARR